MSTLVFDFPLGWQAGLPLVALVLGLAAWLPMRRGVPKRRVAIQTGLRLIALLALVFLVSKPMWVATERKPPGQRPVLLLVDRSESMSLKENDRTRYRQAYDLLRDHLLPAFKADHTPVRAWLFAEEATQADGPQLGAAEPTGKRTNLGGALARVLAADPNPPLAVVALTDGIVNENGENARGLAALVESRTPFIGIGLGSDAGARLFALRSVDAPPVVATNTIFQVAAQLEMVNCEELEPLDLSLMRDGRMVQRKKVSPGSGSRYWQESFEVTESLEGLHRYSIQFLPPAAPGLQCLNSQGSASVQVASEKELRVLYVQGALTWEYKFIGLALKGDPAIKITGLTRTSKQSIFRQNIETDGELKLGFPVSTEEIAPFRVVVLSNLTPLDFTPAQQELLAHFCGDLGGGVLMIGGPATFNSTWRGTRLEQLLPVTFPANSEALGLDRPFRVQLTEEALQHPLFRVASDRSTAAAWSQLPLFAQYGRVGSLKPGAQVWLEHPEDRGPSGKRILMASQRYGAGISAVIAVQNLWRWRLARDSDVQQYDRFWRQLFRFVGEPVRQDIMISLADQDLRPNTDIQVALQRRVKALDTPGLPAAYRFQVEDESKAVVASQALELPPGRLVASSFHPAAEGLFTLKVLDAYQAVVASRTVDIRDLHPELQQTGRNMEILAQWAHASGGLAVKAEECGNPAALVAQIKAKVEQVRRTHPVREPIGVNAWMMLAVLGSLGTEWCLRKKWNLS